MFVADREHFKRACGEADLPVVLSDIVVSAERAGCCELQFGNEKWYNLVISK